MLLSPCNFAAVYSRRACSLHFPTVKLHRQSSRGYSAEGLLQDSIVPLMNRLRVSASSSPLAADRKIARVASYNILWDLRDEITKAEYRWEQRKPRLIRVIEEMDADIVCLQEDRIHLLKQLERKLSNTYAYFGIPGQWEECCSILFRKERFSLLEGKRVSLSEDYYRHATVVSLQDKYTHKDKVIVNTHLSFTSMQKRQEQASTLGDLVKRVSECDSTIILCGDLNTFPKISQLPKYLPNDGDEVQRIVKSGLLMDSKDVAVLGHVGADSSYNNNPLLDKQNGRCNPFSGLGLPGVVLDHIFLRKGQSIIHGINPVRVNGLFASDHMPVICDISL